VRHLIELHDGKVEAKSEGVNCGATFIVTLPVVDSYSDNLLPEVSRSFSQATGFLKNRRILIVEDDVDARELLRYVLEAQQVTVSIAASAQDAIAQINLSTPDLIISDINMPEMDGYRSH
jgi:PleD family two-component response regulator